MLIGSMLALAACTDHFEPPDVHGRPLMVADAGQPRLWVLSKQEQVKLVTRSTRYSYWRQHHKFHFRVQAFDPHAARPLWTRRVLTLGNPDAGLRDRRIIGSAASGRLLGQEGDTVWLLIDDKPLALAVADGSQVADASVIEQRNPRLKGLLPTDARHYGFDRGLVIMAADATRHVVRGEALRAEPYAPAAPARAEPERKANGMPVIVPTPPFGEIPARQAWLDGQWLGLYSEEEAADAADDGFGTHLRWPYTVLDRGAIARRGFWRADIVEVRRWNEPVRRLASLTPIPGSPVFLKGRFLKDLATREPLLLEAPAGIAVWHSTRFDETGRLALTRLDASLRKLWTAELPIGESGTANPVTYWLLPGRIVAMGAKVTIADGVRQRTPHLASIALADGRLRAWDLRAERPVDD